MITISPWPETIADARPLQERLAKEIRLVPLANEPATVAGVDAAFDGDRIVAVATLFDFRTLAQRETAHVIQRVTFPYIPGYLSFREAPAMLAAIGKLSQQPGLLIVDGQGIAHPRRMGIASFLGVVLGLPAIGSAKSRLIGDYDEPGPERGSMSPLLHHGERIGTVLRTRTGVRPLFISPGHLVTADEAVKIILRLAARYRLPEPQRAADAISRQIKRDNALLSPAKPGDKNG
jgi:deoxyribonuclease V